jgi:hypothetical protein
MRPPQTPPKEGLLEPVILKLYLKMLLHSLTELMQYE